MRVKDNPFYVLGVTPYDTLETINEKYDEKAFMDEDNERVYDDARQILSSPNKRLTAEVRWFYNLTGSVDSELNKIERYANYDDNDFLNLDNELDLEYATPRENLLFNLEKLPYISKTYAASEVKKLEPLENVYKMNSEAFGFINVKGQGPALQSSARISKPGETGAKSPQKNLSFIVNNAQIGRPLWPPFYYIVRHGILFFYRCCGRGHECHRPVSCRQGCFYQRV